MNLAALRQTPNICTIINLPVDLELAILCHLDTRQPIISVFPGDNSTPCTGNAIDSSTFLGRIFQNPDPAPAAFSVTGWAHIVFLNTITG